MPDIQDTAARIEALLEREERRLAAVFRAAVRDVKEGMDLEAVAALLEQGRFEEALDLTRVIGERLGLAAQTSFIASATATTSWLAGAGVSSILFDQANERAVRLMRATTLRLITDFTSDQRDAARAAMASGIERGLNPREQARAFRASVGLTAHQMGIVENYRRKLERVGQRGVTRGRQLDALKNVLRDARSDRSVHRALARMSPLPAAQIDNMVERYQARYIKHRAVAIARTEALAVVHEGVEEALQQGAQQGLYALEDLEREWDSAGDARVRDTHRFLNGQKKPPGEPWRTSNGAIRYPGDPLAPASERIHCRCVLLTRLKYAVAKVAAPALPRAA